MSLFEWFLRPPVFLVRAACLEDFHFLFLDQPAQAVIFLDAALQRLAQVGDGLQAFANLADGAV